MSFGIKRPRSVAPGDPVSASNTNATRVALDAVREARNFLFTNRPRPWSESMVHQITAINGDYLECVRVWARNPEILGTKTVFVARPARLRRSETARGGVTYTYADDQNRTADNGSETEQQRVTTDYLVGDRIEVRVIRGKIGITEVDNQRGSPVDANVDGRVWAKVPP